MDIEFINIETRKEFDALLDDLRRATIVVADTETNGLKYYRGNYVISISIYFPEFKRTYNIPYRHGEGTVNVEYKEGSEGTDYSDITWQGKTKPQLFLRYWWSKFYSTKVNTDFFGNIPEAWVDELKELWGAEGVTYVFHNARFDLHMLNAEGFPTPTHVEDTMIALHLVHEDWKGIEIEAPYKVNGKWAISETGEPFKRKSRGNRQLKWQSMYFGLPMAHVGETELIDAKTEMEEELTKFIMTSLMTYYNYEDEELDPYLEGLVYADILKRKEGAFEKWYDKQKERIQKKVQLDSKGNMWMLPSDKVATYAMLDTVLTWMLREKLMTIMEKWDNVELYHNLCDIQTEVAWVMEKNGLLINMDEARKQVQIYLPRIEEIEGKFNELAEALSEAYGTHTVKCSDCKGTGKVVKTHKRTIDEQLEALAETLKVDKKRAKELRDGEVLDTELVIQLGTYQTEEECECCAGTGKVEKLIVEPTINPNSSKFMPDFMQKAVQISFDDLDDFIPSWVDGETKAKLINEPCQVKTGQLVKVNKEALRPFEDHPVVWMLLEYRKLNKTVNTYLKNWMEARDSNNIVRGSLDVTGTVAGRMSSYGDMGNLQNIPERGGYSVKKAFIAHPDHLLFAIDYGQLEARLAAWIAEVVLPSLGAYTIEPTMTKLFEGGADMHAYVRDMIGIRDIMFGDMSNEDILTWSGVDYSTMSNEQRANWVAKKICRQIAKTLNFGLLYSGTYRMVMKLLRCGETQARELERRWRDLFPAFALAQEYFENESQTWRATPSGIGMGMYSTQPITGRHRKLHMYSTYQRYFDDETNSWKSFNPRQANARKVWNNTVQGLGGWMSVNAMLNFAREVGYGQMLPYAQIHDALDGQIHVDDLSRIPILMDYMVDYDVRPSLTVDLEAGWNWQPANNANLFGMEEVHDVDLWVYTKGQEHGLTLREDNDGNLSWREGRTEWHGRYTDKKACERDYYALMEDKYGYIRTTD